MAEVGGVSYDPETKIWTSLEQKNVYNPEVGLGPIILFTLEKTPNKVTQINADDGSVMTCAEMRSKSIRVAVNLTKMGFKQGDVISIASKNVPDVAAVVFGCWIIGVTVNTLDFVYNLADSGRMLKLVNPKVLICDQESFNASKDSKFDTEILVFNDKSIEKLFQNIENEDNFIPPKLDDAANCIGLILCSSGTTGVSKGIKLSHAHIIYYHANFLPSNHDDLIITNFATILWVSAFFTLVYGTLYGGKRLITTQETTPETIERLINRFNVTQLFLNNYYSTLLVEYLRENGKNLPTLKIIGISGAFVTKKLADSVRKIIPNGHVVIGYGSSEIGIATLNITTEFDNAELGVLINGLKIKIIDENGKSLGPGEIGEICVKNRYPFSGYVANDEATRETLDAEGWVHTGDLGYYDQDKTLIYYERKKDVIEFEGKVFVSPSELEALVVQIPGVVSVCVVGLMEETGYGRPAAVVVKAKDSPLTEKEVQDYVKARVDPTKDLSGGVYFVDEMPLTATGKILRRKAKEIAEEIRKKK